MTKLFSVLLFLLLSASIVSAQLKNPAPAPVVDYHETLMKATFALYSRYTTADAKKPFRTDFRCTATVVAGEPGDYALLTAGHCFDDKDRPGLQYFVSESVSDDPVLQSVEVVRKANTKRYDYAILTLHSPRVYPVIQIDLGPVPGLETAVVNVNFGLGLTKQLVKGFVGSGIITREEAPVDCGMCAGRYMVEFGIAPGASGSAIVDEKTHKIVGLVEAIFNGLANGTVAMPLGHNFDDFLVDGSLDQKPLPPVAQAPDGEFTRMVKGTKSVAQESSFRWSLALAGIALLAYLAGYGDSAKWKR